MTILAGSGHRPQKIGGFKVPNSTYNYINKALREILSLHKPDKILSGMALGFDTWLAEAAIDLGISFDACVPFDGQDSVWPQESKDKYNKLLSRANNVIIVCPGGYAAWKMQKRNQYMVDNCDILCACYNGDKSGGTFNCVQYAETLNKTIVYIDPNKSINHEM